MARPKDVNDHATAETRRKGAEAANEARRVKKAEAEEIARQAIYDMAAAAVTRKWQLLASEDETVAGREVRDVFDRLLGKPKQTHEHETGEKPLEVEVKHTVDDLADVARLLARAGALPVAGGADPAAE